MEHLPSLPANEDAEFVENDSDAARKRTLATRDKLARLKRTLDQAHESAEPEKQQRYETLSNDVEEFNHRKDRVVQRLDSEGILDRVQGLPGGWILGVSFGVDRDRVMRGTEPPTFYSDARLDQVVTDTPDELFDQGEEFITVGGKQYPKTIIVNWDEVYDHVRTINLETASDGKAFYRSYRHVWDLRNLIRSVDDGFRQVNVSQIEEEDLTSNTEKSFDETHQVAVVEHSLEEEVLQNPMLESWHIARLANQLLDEWRKEIPGGLENTVYSVLLAGTKVVASRQGDLQLVIRESTAPVFRRFYHVLFPERRGFNRPLTKYSDGSYATPIRSGREFVQRLDLGFKSAIAYR